jgi:hypothetical protein
LEDTDACMRNGDDFEMRGTQQTRTVRATVSRGLKLTALERTAAQGSLHACIRDCCYCEH